ncbi:S8 family peptidase [Sorangium sp. So ce204]|uniref:S8 family peptidase n=1 Tax=Sorangium sp. So ce204 TaxID=3133288 RepID=UPI003F5F37C1
MATKEIDRRRHLLLTGTSAAEPYTSPQQGGGETRLPPVDPAHHGNALKKQLERVRKDLRARDTRHDAIAVEARRGVYLEVASASGFDLALQSLEDRRAGVELAATRTQTGVTYATVYVPSGQLGYFEKKVEEYLTKTTKKSGNPKNKPLIESIAEIRLAVLEGFWTDDPALFPPAGKAICWEVWLRGEGDDLLARFREYAQKVKLQVGDEQLRFPDRLIVLAYGTREQMTGSIELLDVIAELRLAKEVPTSFVRMNVIEQEGWAKDLKDRITAPSPDAPAVCIVDTGVNAGHPLLEPALRKGDLHAYDPSWGVHDDDGHGTGMAGIALHGDLAEALLSSSPVALTHRLESVKILHKGAANPPKLYGAITAEGVARAEIAAPQRKRAISMAITATDFRDRGQPSSWSAEIDKLCSGMDDDNPRLFVVSAGNIRVAPGMDYRSRNETEGIHDPGQAWNALTVGAYTERTRITEPVFNGWSPIARPGDLSPSSTTSCIWQSQWPIKPEIVMEGGNMALSPDGKDADFPDSLSLLTTHYQPFVKMFTVTGETSAASAGASRVGAVIWAQYPDFWPETIRALLVHTAEWTPRMREEINATRSRRRDMEHLLRCFGFGVPNLERALWSAGNALTLVVQDELRPFERDKSNEMRLHTLPWPKQALLDLSSVEVELRVTLSYFIEPNPARRGWERRHRYASHGLRFAVQKANEEPDDLRKRVNKAARDGDETIDSGDAGWLLGPTLREKGSVHHDRWKGTAADLASRKSIAVCPVIGWWRERHQLGRWKKAARYALIVSIRTPETGVDIYEPVANQVKIATAVPV